MPTLPPLSRRADGDGDDVVCNYWGCYSYTSYVIKWVVFAGLIGALLIFFIVGHIHAKRRMKKGLAPLSYHRWLISRRKRMAFHASHPNLPNPFYTQQRQWYTPGYGMHSMPNQQYGPPPPQYGTPEWLPAYQPPADGSAMNAAKTNPNQTYNVAELGPPPPGAGSGSGGTSNRL